MAMTIEEIKAAIKNGELCWYEVDELRDMLKPSHKEVLAECSLDELNDYTEFYCYKESQEHSIRDYCDYELISELLYRETPTHKILDELNKKDIASYVLSNFDDFADEDDLKRWIVRFVLRDDLKDYVS